MSVMLVGVTKRERRQWFNVETGEPVDISDDSEEEGYITSNDKKNEGRILGTQRRRPWVDL